MKKVKLYILGLSYSQTQTGAYALVLAEEKGERRIPIIIGAPEAQAIAIQLEKLKPTRPLTHDLFVNFARSFNINLVEINIFKLEEGIFYSELVCEHKGEVLRVDARTSDAVALALRFGRPIYTTEEILRKAGIILDIDERGRETHYTPRPQKNYEDLDLEELNNRLNEAVQEENYEEASKIRDEINRRDQEDEDENKDSETE